MLARATKSVRNFIIQTEIKLVVVFAIFIMHVFTPESPDCDGTPPVVTRHEARGCVESAQTYINRGDHFS